MGMHTSPWKISTPSQVAQTAMDVFLDPVWMLSERIKQARSEGDAEAERFFSTALVLLNDGTA
ncbi:hypothetical protein [Pelagibius sp. Alg239-R121]|uniref:hypothetical protein n=1 Tax=Pelagibius sp. Alg239-R121 TaxID=2993448 RepID=UPI0024A778EE|nr:hypothetical protein [Pelagibius sp. Alg239-R121]